MWGLGVLAVALAGCGRYGFATPNEAGADPTTDGGDGGDGNAAGDGGDGGGGCVLAADNFDRSSSGAWGQAPVGGTWNLSSATNETFSVNGLASIAIAASDSRSSAWLDCMPAVDVEARVVVTFDRLPNVVGTYEVETFIRGSEGNNNAYTLDVRLQFNGALRVKLVRYAPASDLTTPVTALSNVVPGEPIALMVRATGTQPATLCGTVWRAGSAEPSACTVTATDSTAALAQPGTPTFSMSNNMGPVPVTISLDNFAYGCPQS